MIIRSQQFDAFQSQANAGLARRIIEFLRSNCAETIVQFSERATLVEALPDEAFFGMVQNGIARARSYGMTLESSLGAFVVLMFVAAPNFDSHPLIHRVLKDESIDPDSRIDQLWQRASEQNWEAIQQNYDANAWTRKAEENGQ